MHRPVQHSELATLRQCWSQWTRIVELFAMRRPARRRVDTAAYQALRADVLAACRALGEDQAVPQQAFYQSLEGVVKPWLTPMALERADQEILNCLLAWCLTAQRQLWGGRDPRQARQQARRWVAGSAAAVGVGIVVWLLVGFAPAVLEWLADRGHDLLGAARKSTPTQRWVAGGIAVVLGAMWLVAWRQRR